MSIDIAFPTALFSALNGAKASLGVTGVHDKKPQDTDGGSGAAFPYVVYSVFPAMLDTSTEFGFRILFRVHVYSRTGSKTESLGIQAGIYDLLHRQSLSVTGFNVYDMYRDDSECNANADDNIHGMCEYVAYAEKI